MPASQVQAFMPPARREEVELSIAAAGDAIVWARGTLKVNVAGSGGVKYLGDAEVDQSVIGSGSIKRLGGAPSGS